MLYCYVILKAHYEVSSTQSMYLLNLTVLVAYTPPTPAQHIRQLSRVGVGARRCVLDITYTIDSF